MSVSVRILFFAAYRELLGRSEFQVELPDGAAVVDLVDGLRSRGAPFDSLPARPTVAVNRVYAPLSAPLGPGDEVAFIPPVAGG
jgi:molybdopterin converting factor subunit 1